MSVNGIDELIEALAGVVRKAEADADCAGYFATLYRQVSVEVREAIRAGRFDDGQRMSRFDAIFGNRYFDALEAWRRDRTGSSCWRVAFELAQRADAIIVQHLLLGVNAHINLDLAVAAAQTSPGSSIHELERDFLLINDILVGVLVQLQQAIDEVSPYMWLLDTFGGRDEDRILDFSVRAAREEAWLNAVVLAQQTGAERDQTIARLDARAAELARLVSRPGGLVRPVIRLIRCGERTPVPGVIARLDGATQARQRG
jgi:non-ribosomal peptide synthetase component F